ncbi:MAG: hypothetical protein ACPIOQ_27445, partial [Promethearchaeia archaeon]
MFTETRVVGLFEGALDWIEATRLGGAPLGRERGGRPAGGSNKLDFGLMSTCTRVSQSWAESFHDGDQEPRQDGE